MSMSTTFSAVRKESKRRLPAAVCRPPHMLGEPGQLTQGCRM